ncbi:hypothetical protein [Halarchaeum nitratireducens]|uniref:Uncharacterized protein n=1 Tax=Halarchaeum nitratireducens TaxID=489913 RepID=A0A830G7X6_9EURY|nr:MULTISPECIES: hypothetical protein [Halarchaeum]MBP2251221.1 uncharacterized protein involved in response to NO [Halarchaeum solikamskense]GGN06820.1 hypothetical protein GCM10009021_02240 [Halarchaeum nitratireducens]
MPSDEPRPIERTASEPMATRYDLVLAAIPLAFLAGSVAALATGIDASTGVTAGSVGALCALGYAIFGDPPIERGGGGRPS